MTFSITIPLHINTDKEDWRNAEIKKGVKRIEYRDFWTLMLLIIDIEI